MKSTLTFMFADKMWVDVRQSKLGGTCFEKKKRQIQFSVCGSSSNDRIYTKARQRMGPIPVHCIFTILFKFVTFNVGLFR